MTTRPKIGLALAGGGPEGAIWELGVLGALDDAIEGFESHRLDTYVGVSAGAFLSACLANGMTAQELTRNVVRDDRSKYPFSPGIFFTPAVGHWIESSLRLPGKALEALAEFMKTPGKFSAWSAVGHLAQALPVGLFRNEPIRHYLHAILTKEGRTDDFRQLPGTLVIVATDLDSGQTVRFGESDFDEVPISRAVQASTALPGLYPPVKIDGHSYVDGVLQKTMHASVALDRNVDLLVCLNPIVPLESEDENLAAKGLPSVLSQSFRAMIHSRFVVGMASYEPRFPEQELLVFEPDADDRRMFFTNLFRFSSRHEICEHAYRSTMRQLKERRESIVPLLERHGLSLREDALDLEPTCTAPADTDADISAAHTRLGGLLDKLEVKLDNSRS